MNAEDDGGRRIAGPGSRGHLDAPPHRHGFPGARAQGLEQPPDEVLIRHDGRQTIGQRRPKLDPVGTRGGHRRKSAPDDLREVEDTRCERPAFADVQQVTNEERGAARRVPHFLQEPPHRGARIGLLDGHLRVTLDDQQDVVQVVRHTAGEAGDNGAHAVLVTGQGRRRDGSPGDRK